MYELTNKIISFLHRIGIHAKLSSVDDSAFLPGLYIHGGTLIIDTERLKYPGDILHEAGHIAVTAPDQRASLTGDVHKCGHGPAEEMAAIAWSWAALKEIGLMADVLFHQQGYKGGSTSYIEAFENQQYFGYPMLVYWRLTNNPDEPGGYPQMLTWLRD